MVQKVPLIGDDGDLMGSDRSRTRVDLCSPSEAFWLSLVPQPPQGYRGFVGSAGVIHRAEVEFSTGIDAVHCVHRILCALPNIFLPDSFLAFVTEFALTYIHVMDILCICPNERSPYDHARQSLA